MKKSKSKDKGTWFEVVAHADALAKQVIEVPGGQRYTIRGPIQDVMIVTFPQKQMEDSIINGTFNTTMEALSTAVRGGGFEGGLIIVPEGLGFMKLQSVDRITAKLLEQRDQRQKAEYEKQLQDIKEEQKDGVKPSILDELKPDTKTVGEA
jgi:hypothetical protein